MKVQSINAGFFKLDGGAMFGIVPKTLWNKKNPSDDLNLCSWSTRCLLVEDGNRLILFDTGIGEKQDHSFLKYYFLHGEDNLVSNIEKCNYSTDEITDVILTHLHFDHCGGALKTQDGKHIPTFKNATYWVSKSQWDWATINPNIRERPSFLKENIFPIQESGQLNFVEDINLKINDNIYFEISNGHTKGLLVSFIKYKGKTLVYPNDMIPSSSHISPNYIMAYDCNPMDTLNEKSTLCEKLIQDDHILCFDHDPKLEACTIMKTEKGFSINESISLNDL